MLLRLHVLHQVKVQVRWHVLWLWRLLHLMLQVKLGLGGWLQLSSAGLVAQHVYRQVQGLMLHLHLVAVDVVDTLHHVLIDVARLRRGRLDIQQRLELLRMALVGLTSEVVIAEGRH